MNLLEEHIKLLQAQFAIIQRNYAPIRKYRAGRNCRKGYNCGGSCITRSKNCRKALEGEAKNFSEWMINKMSDNMGAVLGEKPKDAPKAKAKAELETRRGSLEGATVSPELQSRVDERIKDLYTREDTTYKPRSTMDEAAKMDSLPDSVQTYIEAKAQAPENDIVFVKSDSGDFYLTHFDDAAKFVEVIDGENKNVQSRMLSEDPGGPIAPMSGFPAHALERYASDVMKSGFGITVVDNKKSATSKPAPPPKAELAPIPKAIQDEIAKRGPDFDFLVEDYRYGVDGKAKAEQALANAKTKAEKNAAREQVDRYRAAARDGYTMRSKLPQAMQAALNNSRASGSLFGKNQDPTNPRDPANTEEILINQWRRDGLIADPFNEAGMPTRKPRR